MCTRSKIQPSLISGLTPSIERIYVDAEFFGSFDNLVIDVGVIRDEGDVLAKGDK